MQTKRSGKKNFLHSKFLFFGLLLFFSYIGYAVIINVLSFYSYQREASMLSGSIETRMEEKKALEEVIALLESDTATENIARTKLGWTKVGETTVVFTEDETKKDVRIDTEQSNIQKWKDYFFSAE